jgi:hypothetical protein
MTKQQEIVMIMINKRTNVLDNNKKEKHMWLDCLGEIRTKKNEDRRRFLLFGVV